MACGRGGDELDELDVVDVLDQLVDKSLVVADDHADGGVRYRLLEGIRQYGAERLEAEGETARDAGILSALSFALAHLAGYPPIEESARALALLDEAADASVQVGNNLSLSTAMVTRCLSSSARPPLDRCPAGGLHRRARR